MTDERSESNRAVEALRWHAAYHEAGHAVVAIHLHVPIGRVELITDADGPGVGCTEFLLDKFSEKAQRAISSKNPRLYFTYIRHEMMAILAGALSAEKFSPDPGWGIDSQGRRFTGDQGADIEALARIARDWHNLSAEQTGQFIPYLRDKTLKIINSPHVSKAIRRTAVVLIERKQITAKQVRAIYREVRSRQSSTPETRNR